MDNQSPKERRQFRRYPFREDVLIDGIMQASSIDISEGGMYLSAVQQFNQGDVIDVTIPFRGEKIKVKARVQYFQAGIGMGVMFIELPEEQKAKIRGLIESITAEPDTVKIEKKILLIEDNEKLRSQLKSRLSSEGFTVIEASDGIDAMKSLAEISPDLIILDLFMEKMDGFKVLSILKLHPIWKDLPVIVCSGRGTDDVIRKVIDAGADEFLNKMVTSPTKLIEVTKAILQRKPKD